MSQFTQFDEFSRTDSESTDYILEEDLYWHIMWKNSPFPPLIVPKGYKFNFSSPWWLSWLISRHNRKWLPAAAVHDRLLELGADRSGAAAEFRRGLVARGESNWKAWPMFVAVWLWTVIT